MGGVACFTGFAVLALPLLWLAFITFGENPRKDLFRMSLATSAIVSVLIYSVWEWFQLVDKKDDELKGDDKTMKTPESFTEEVEVIK